jgi:hypothetical protein
MSAMSMPVKLSDSLVLDARLAGETMERSIAGQVEFWARLGRAIDPILNGTQVMRARRRAPARSLAEVLADVEEPSGRKRVADHLACQPFPHFEQHPDRQGLLVRIEANGTRTVGRFVQRVFTAVMDA